MNDSSAVAEKPGPLTLATLLAFVFCVLIVGALTMTEALNISAVLGRVDTVSGRQQLRFSLMLSNLLMFAGTAFLGFLIVYRKQWAAAAGLDRGPAKQSTVYAAGLFIAALPLVTWLAYWNLQLELPEWMAQSEESADVLLGAILQMESVPEFIMALMAAAVTPALGEELLLRGIVQRRIMQPFFGNHHVAIWLAAALFSAMHLEFGGFAPRLILGVLLGYGYYWSKSLWVPIVLHFLFNGMQVAVAFATGEFDPQADMTEVPPAWLGMVSLIATAGVFYYASRKFSGGDAGAEVV